MRLLLAATAFLAGFVPAQAAEPPYLDNRSDAAALIKSYYNAINRREYARAWDYFGEAKPSGDFAAFVAGFDDTDTVHVATGAASVEGAAGSTISQIPVSILAIGRDKSEKVFAGCFTLRLSSPTAQEPPFRALTIEKAELKPAEAPFEVQLPEKCGDAPPVDPKDTLLQRVVAQFEADYADRCPQMTVDNKPTNVPEVHDIAYRDKDSSEDDPERHVTLFRFSCGSGAYNESHVYYLDDEINGIRLQRFAEPDLDIRYVDDNYEGKVESMTIIGYTTRDELINSFYDPQSHSITAWAKWRGVGDASSSGNWLFRNGEFTLVHYEVDASYDEEINPEVVLDFNTAP